MRVSHRKSQGQHRDMGVHAFRSYRPAFSAYYYQHKIPESSDNQCLRFPPLRIRKGKGSIISRWKLRKIGRDWEQVRKGNTYISRKSTTYID